MSSDPNALAEKLLDAQVEFVIAELTGDRFEDVIRRDVADVLGVADTLIVGEVVDRAHVKETAHRVVDKIGGSDIVTEMVEAIAEAIYDLAESDEYSLGDVVDREPVAALIEQFLAMHTLHNRALERLTESPLVATVASSFVNKIVADFMAANRARAEKVPGMSRVLKAGSSAASKVRSAGDRHLEGFIGDVAGRGAQFALRRTNNAIKELIHDAPLHDAAMELWDLHADEPVSVLREYLSKQELREVVMIVLDIVESGRNKEYFGHVVEACIDVFFDRYGEFTVAALLPELGLTGDDIVTELITFAPPVIEAAKENGVLASQIRARLAPFFTSEQTLELLASAQAD
ncbi:hypothetical protein [Antrihabitans spumae]|uniref:DUF2336 domain-containing protein n=1 Tax=Antrihabitans spumae TaxID=3373370 RepID=A0ABW7KIM5_9NOCA